MSKAKCVETPLLYPIGKDTSHSTSNYLQPRSPRLILSTIRIMVLTLTTTQKHMILYRNILPSIPYTSPSDTILASRHIQDQITITSNILHNPQLQNSHHTYNKDDYNKTTCRDRSDRVAVCADRGRSVRMILRDRGWPDEPRCPHRSP